MGSSPQSNTAGSRIVTIKVSEYRSNGIQVVLEDGRQGFIRSREVSWERRISRPASWPQPGESRPAVILEEPPHGSVLLSLRMTTNPWAEALAKRSYLIDQDVEGEVVNIQSNGAYVQLEPGVDAVLYPGEAPLLNDERLDEILMLGDRIFAVVTNIDRKNHLVEISVTKRLQKFDREWDIRHEDLKKLFGAERHPRRISPPGPVTGAQTTQAPAAAVSRTNDLRMQKILAIDNEPKWLEELEKTLNEEYGITLRKATSQREAQAFLKANTLDLILIDMRLDDGENGLEVAKELRSAGEKTPIMIMSSALSSEEMARLDREGFPYSDKSTSGLIKMIGDLQYGRWLPPQQTLPERSDDYARQLGLQEFERRPLPETLGLILASLRRQTGATYAFVVELNPAKFRVSIAASHPPLEMDLLKFIEDGLFFSPVRQVLVERQDYYDNYVDQVNNKKYKYFFTSLKFSSWLGMQIKTTGLNNKYGLFLLDEAPRSFDPDQPEGTRRKSLAHTACAFLAVALERASLVDSLRQYSEQIAQGQLLDDLVHETRNKLHGMKAYLRSMQNLANQPSDSQSAQKPDWPQTLQQTAQKIIDEQADLNSLIEAYYRQSKNQYEAVDINQVVEIVARQLRQTAKEAGVDIFLDCPALVDSAQGVRANVQQIILNMVLNAIQMIDLQRQRMKKVSLEAGQRYALLQRGAIVIQTRWAGEAATRRIEVRVIDSGPGVHFTDRDSIFNSGVSKRGGAGLGLYISRNLAQRMGGDLVLCGSALFVGSAFILQLQSFQQGEGKA